MCRKKENKPLFTFEVNGTVDQGCSLEFVFVIIFFFGEILNEMHMLSTADVNGTGGFSVEFMIMAIGKISMEFHFVEVILFARYFHGFAGYRTKSVIMAFVTFPEDSGTAGKFVNVFLFFAFRIIIRTKLLFFFYKVC